MVYQNFFMLKLFKSNSLRRVISIENFFSWNPNILALELEADLVEWTVKGFVSMQARPCTFIIQRDTVEVKTPL